MNSSRYLSFVPHGQVTFSDNQYDHDDLLRRIEAIEREIHTKSGIVHDVTCRVIDGVSYSKKSLDCEIQALKQQIIRMQRENDVLMEQSKLVNDSMLDTVRKQREEIHNLNEEVISLDILRIGSDAKTRDFISNGNSLKKKYVSPTRAKQQISPTINTKFKNYDKSMFTIKYILNKFCRQSETMFRR